MDLDENNDDNEDDEKALSELRFMILKAIRS
jgi:hypothetical protein